MYNDAFYENLKEMYGIPADFDKYRYRNCKSCSDLLDSYFELKCKYNANIRIRDYLMCYICKGRTENRRKIETMMENITRKTQEPLNMTEKTQTERRDIKRCISLSAIVTLSMIYVAFFIYVAMQVCR